MSEAPMYRGMDNEPVYEWEVSDMFRDYLDEILPEVRIGSYTYGAGRVLAEIDPIAFRCDMLMWADDKVTDGEWSEWE